MARLRTVVFGLLLVFLILLSTFVLIFWFDIKVSYINPPEQSYTLAIPFWYPNIEPGGNIIFNDEIYGSIYLTYSGVIAEGVGVSMQAEVIGSQKFNNISYIVASFGGANLAPTVGKPGTYLEEFFQGVILTKTNEQPQNLGIYFDDGNTFIGARTVTWLTQGYYYPTITIHFNDSTVVTEPLPNYAIHVYAQDFLRQQETDRANTTLSLALFSISVVGLIDICLRVWKWRKEAIEKETEIRDY